VAGSSPRDRTRAAERAVRRFQQQTSGRGPRDSPIRLTINDDDPANTRGFDRVFVGLGVTLSGLTSVLGDPAVLRVIRQQFERNFAEERGRTRWAQLAPSTVADRRRRGYGGAHPILVRTGALRRHVLTTPAKTTRQARGAELRIAPSPSVNGVRKYRMLAMGGVTPTGGRVPSRPMVVIDSSGAVRVTSAISRALRARAAANGLR
jgi:hypothetical protein